MWMSSDKLVSICWIPQGFLCKWPVVPVRIWENKAEGLCFLKGISWTIVQRKQKWRGWCYLWWNSLRKVLPRQLLLKIHCGWTNLQNWWIWLCESLYPSDAWYTLVFIMYNAQACVCVRMRVLFESRTHTYVFCVDIVHCHGANIINMRKLIFFFFFSFSFSGLPTRLPTCCSCFKGNPECDSRL